MQNGIPPSEPGQADASETPDRFYERPTLNSPNEYPGRHWELDEGTTGRRTGSDPFGGPTRE